MSKFLPNLSIPDARTLFSTTINSRQETVSGQACNPPDPHWYISFSFGGEVLRYPVPKWLLFLNQCGGWFSFPALFSFFFSSQITRAIMECPTTSDQPGHAQLPDLTIDPQNISTPSHANGQGSSPLSNWKRPRRFLYKEERNVIW